MDQIWRAKLYHEELASCGFARCETDDQRWRIISGLLTAKGLPEKLMADKAPFKCSEEDDGLMLEFGGV